jgi:hypothetical protein
MDIQAGSGLKVHPLEEGAKVSGEPDKRTGRRALK